MKNGFRKFYPVALLSGMALCLPGTGCKKAESGIPRDDHLTFSQYWHQGKAEISSYSLQQSRYGTQHKGTAVLVYVTEDFSKTRHVKLEDPAMHKSDAIPVMKLNFMTEFVTGIYEYQLMNSVFTPLDHQQYPHSLKLTSGTQDWCGQAFLQYNWKGNRYDIQQFSYFESEGDKTFSIANGWLEDEIWTHIRTAPESLPVGNVKLIPSAFYIRLSKVENKVYEAHTVLQSAGPVYVYTIQYPELNRSLSIEFEMAFPHRIMSWNEDCGNGQITTGKRRHTLLSAYWEHQMPADTTLRGPLFPEE